MPEVIDTNVLRVASSMDLGEAVETPVTDAAVVERVHNWVKEFRRNRDRHLVLDRPGGAIRSEYQRNLPEESYGRRVFIDKFTKGAVHFVELTYWSNGAERVADLPDPALEKNFHDLGDRVFVAAAFAASAPIINAVDSDWTEPAVEAGLKALGIEVVQLLSSQERRSLRRRA